MPSDDIQPKPKHELQGIAGLKSLQEDSSSFKKPRVAIPLVWEIRCLDTDQVSRAGSFEKLMFAWPSWANFVSIIWIMDTRLIRSIPFYSLICFHHFDIHFDPVQQRSWIWQEIRPPWERVVPIWARLCLQTSSPSSPSCPSCPVAKPWGLETAANALVKEANLDFARTSLRLANYRWQLDIGI